MGVGEGGVREWVRGCVGGGVWRGWVGGEGG